MPMYTAIERANAEDIAKRLRAALALGDTSAVESGRSALRMLLAALPEGSPLIDEYMHLVEPE